jgi:predicted nucleic acid-binding Zn ribbon protein
MPTYEFRCPDGTIVERVFKMSEVPQTIPSPNGDGVAVRIISGGADLIFKGSGFYITDYGKDGKKDQRAQGEKGTGNREQGEKKTASDGAPASGDKSTPATKSEKSEKSDKSDKPDAAKKPDKTPPPSGAAA